MEDQKTERIIAKVAAFVPFVYVGFVALFFLWVSILEGHFPSYGNPDPKNYLILFYIEILLIALVPISFVLWLIMGIKLALDQDWSLRYYFLMGTIGFFLIRILVQIDPMGIFNWLAD